MAFFRVLITVVFLFTLVPSNVTGQLTFNISSTGNSDVDQAFQLAGDFWASQFNDDATINVTAGWEDLGGSVLGSSRNSHRQYGFNTVKAALLGNVVTADDQSFYDGMSTTGSFNVYANNTNGNPNGTGYYTTNLSTVFVSRSNQKALGLIDPHATESDTEITFNSTFSFDFDPSDGIDAGKIDFVGVAIHEIGHSLGFTSSVDIIGGLGDQLPISSLGPNLLDMSRFSPDSVTNNAIDLTYDTRPKFFSIDGGASAATAGLNHWSLGGANDGRQASHWKDNLGLGIMDPTAAPAGQLNIVTELDLQAIDIIGWDRITGVPEPSGCLVLASLLIGFGLKRRRQI